MRPFVARDWPGTGRDCPRIPVGDEDLPAVGRNGHGAGVGVFRPVFAEDRFQQLQLPGVRDVPGLQLKAAGAGIASVKRRGAESPSVKILANLHSGLTLTCRTMA